ncbi:uncharacterized protein LOC133865603 [Alnus glutinosa]|uniref:uncharacterized protein LOC133865603 n=1 Tax=Alnus glutinosa TaxID=3517 RepID=UPI002D7786B5|nr:uncharacterized protein LOC133865603 [Alnus glutinosa]
MPPVITSVATTINFIVPGINGLMGLGGGQLSLPSQLQLRGLADMFSYCLPPVSIFGSPDMRRLGGVGGVNVGIGGGGGEGNGNGGRAGDGTNGAEGVGVAGVAGNERGGGEGDGNVGRGGDGTNGAEGVVVGSCAKDELNKGLMMVSMVKEGD